LCEQNQHASLLYSKPQPSNFSFVTSQSRTKVSQLRGSAFAQGLKAEDLGHKRLLEDLKLSVHLKKLDELE